VLDLRYEARNIDQNITSSEVFDDFNKVDDEDLPSDRLKKGKERLKETLECIHTLCEPVEFPKDSPAYIHCF
jgi:type I restriction enzyme, R subunit